MRLTYPSLLAALASPLALAADFTLYLPATPNPFGLPSNTHASLSSLGQYYSAPLSAVNTFVFRNVTPGSYLADVHCKTDAYRPVRVDVTAGGVDGSQETFAAWDTFRGNDWGNKGEVLPLKEGSAGKGVELKALGKKVYFMERPACEYCLRPASPKKRHRDGPRSSNRSKWCNAQTANKSQCIVSVFSVLKNPMILMGLVSMVIFFGMPYLMDNSTCLVTLSQLLPLLPRSILINTLLAVDPDMKAEFEARQRDNPVSSVMGGGQQAQNPLGNFDMAAFLAGSNKKETGGDSSSSAALDGRNEPVRR